jgi:hypothetical protein
VQVREMRLLGQLAAVMRLVSVSQLLLPTACCNSINIFYAGFCLASSLRDAAPFDRQAGCWFHVMLMLLLPFLLTCM